MYCDLCRQYRIILHMFPSITGVMAQLPNCKNRKTYINLIQTDAKFIPIHLRRFASSDIDLQSNLEKTKYIFRNILSVTFIFLSGILSNRSFGLKKSYRKKKEEQHDCQQNLTCVKHFSLQTKIMRCLFWIQNKFLAFLTTIMILVSSKSIYLSSWTPLNNGKNIDHNLCCIFSFFQNCWRYVDRKQIAAEDSKCNEMSG